MIIAVTGAVNGDFSVLQDFPVEPDWVLCTGSVGCFPDPQDVDRATRKRGVGDFPELYLRQECLKYRTLFVEGPHEDHLWLQERASRGKFEILPNLINLKNGNVTVIGDTENSIKILGLGKPFSPSNYICNKNKSYYSEQEINQCCAAGPVDILLVHEGLYGETYGQHTCQAKGIQKIIYATRPQLVVHGHYNASREYSFLDIPCYSLANKEQLLFEVHSGIIKTSKSQ